MKDPRWSHTVMIDLLARLRMASDALGVPVEQITLDDLSVAACQELRRQGRNDLWGIINGP